MIADIAYLFLLGAITISIIFAWKLSRATQLPELRVWRRYLLFAAVAANALSMAGFLVVSFGPRLAANWSPDIHNYSLFLIAAFASIPLAAFGTRAPRALVILNGLALTWLWLDLAATSL